MAEYAAPVDPKEGLFEFAGFRGLRNNVGAESFGPDDLEAALNVDIADDLGADRRMGHGAPVVAGVTESLWASDVVCLGVGSNTLKQINPDWSTVSLLSGLTPNRALSYAAVADRVYWSNGSEKGCVGGGVNRTWGLAHPGVFQLSSTAGTLRLGKYQVAVTWLRQDGQESGTPGSQLIELTDTGGISLSSIPVSTDPTVAYKAIYVTSTDGETPYRVGVIPNADTTFTIRDPNKGASPILTQFLEPPPAGEHIAYWKGWMLVAKGSRLHRSKDYSPELFDLREAVPFLDRITMVAPLNNKSDNRSGIWLGTASQVLFLDGESPEAWSFKPVANYGAIPGAATYADGELIGDGSLAGNTVALFGTERGLCMGQADGSFLNLTQARFAYPIQDTGAAIVRRHNGMTQLVVAFKGAEVAGNVSA